MASFRLQNPNSDGKTTAIGVVWPRGPCEFGIVKPGTGTFRAAGCTCPRFHYADAPAPAHNQTCFWRDKRLSTIASSSHPMNISPCSSHRIQPPPPAVKQNRRNFRRSARRGDPPVVALPLPAHPGSPVSVSPQPNPIERPGQAQGHAGAPTRINPSSGLKPPRPKCR